MESNSKADWLGHSAIIWDRSKVEKTACSYWDPKILSEIASLKVATDPIEKSSNISSITYESLFLVTLTLVESLRERLLSSLPRIDDESDNQLGVPVVVAIPEGPLLPLAVLAAHILNEPLNLQIYAVLVPIEPTEGMERLRHILNEVKPIIVLTMPGSDLDIISDIISTRSLERKLITTKHLFQPEACMVINFLDFIQQAIDRCKTDLNMLKAVAMPGLLASKELSLRMLVLEGLRALRTTCGDNQSTFSPDNRNRMSHILFTSGTTGQPKGCIASIRSLRHYIDVKNEAYGINSDSIVFLASALSFDPCLSDIIATFEAKASLAISPRQQMLCDMPQCLKTLHVTHILCTPALWGLVHSMGAEPYDFPSLRVIALGGEPIPKRMIAKWARSFHEPLELRTYDHPCRLFATYGVTEACVYQTYGEIFKDPEGRVGLHVGTAFCGLEIRLCNENDPTKLYDVTKNGIGEVVLFGAQIDEWSAYLNQPELSSQKFGNELLPSGSCCYYYRTGDRGLFDRSTGNLTILGRIKGESGMVKINGVRVELGEVEAALVDDTASSHPVVVDAMAVAEESEEEGSKQLHAFCVLSKACLEELGINGRVISSFVGAICTRGPLLNLLQMRCQARSKVFPSSFVIIHRVPLSPTGKRDRRKLPALADCVTFDSLTSAVAGDRTLPLREYGISGKVVAESIVDCLNLQPYQQIMLTTSARFVFLGGDSLAATRVVRALYAYHHNVFNTRHLGGEYGTLEGPFDVAHLLRADCLKEYVDLLDACGVCKPHDLETEGIPSHEGQSQGIQADTAVVDDLDRRSLRLYESLSEAATLGHTTIAVALLDVGADPDFDYHGDRLGKVSDRNERKRVFRSSPLHLACVKGDYLLVGKILQKGGRFNVPDASGSFPLHLAASGTNVHADKEHLSEYSVEDDQKRLQCVKLLLEAGAPLSMKDGNKQTVLHCAARSGHCKLLGFIMDKWRSAGEQHEVPIYDIQRGGWFDWTDRWFRTPVHWAILNKRIDALLILLEKGCSARPPKVKKNRQTSAAVETPLELCIRLYGSKDGVGKYIFSALENSP